MTAGTQATISDTLPDDSKLSDSQGEGKAMTDDGSGYQAGHTDSAQYYNWHGPQTPTGSKQFAFDVGTDGLSNDLCSIWVSLCGVYSWESSCKSPWDGDVSLYACSSLTTDVSSGCSLVVTHDYGSGSQSDGRYYSFLANGQIDWDSGTAGTWQFFPVPTGTQSRYYTLKIVETTYADSWNYYFVVKEFEMYFADSSRRRLAEEQRGALPAPEEAEEPAPAPPPSLWQQFIHIGDLDERPPILRRWARVRKNADRRL